jgi:hypothetical protein
MTSSPPYTPGRPGRKRSRTQVERVRRALLDAGRRGITAADFIREPTADGGPAIMRLPSRIVDVRPVLAAERDEIVTAGRRDGCAVYRARRVAPAPAVPASVALPPPEPALFHPPPAAGETPPDRLPLDPWEER